jgi:hypothetical protein
MQLRTPAVGPAHPMASQDGTSPPPAASSPPRAIAARAGSATRFTSAQAIASSTWFNTSFGSACAVNWFHACKAWVAAAGSPREKHKRQEVFEWMQAWVRTNIPSQPLDLSYMGLTQCPPLPPNVLDLQLNSNYLTQWPATLKRDCPRLKRIDISNNEITQLPDGLDHHHPGLMTLNISFNKGCELPNGLPPLRSLNAIGNGLTRLPNLPATLVAVSLQSNEFTDIPEALRSLPYTATVLLINNPIHKDAYERLREATRQPNYGGPVIRLTPLKLL